MVTRNGKLTRMMFLSAIIILAIAWLGVIPASATTLYTTSFETAPHADNPASGWTLGTDSTRTAATWGETAKTTAHTGSNTLWCAGTNSWQVVRDEYTFDNDEDGSGSGEPKTHYHGGLKVTALGTNGAYSTNSYIDVDYFYLRNPVTGESERVEEDDPRLTYTGSGWETTTNARYSGGAAKVSKSTGASVSLYISGSVPIDPGETGANLVTFDIWYVAGHVANDRGRADVYHRWLSTTWSKVTAGLDLSAQPTSYANNMEGYASRDLTLTSAYSSAAVDFWYKIPTNDYPSDFGVFEVSTDGGASWDDQYGFAGTIGTWIHRERPLSSYIPAPSDPPRQIKIRWRWHSNKSSTAQGMYIDDVTISAIKGISTISISPATTWINYGSGAKVTVEGTIGPTAPTAGTPVTIYSKPYPYTGSWVAASTTTDVNGHYQVTVPAAPTQHTKYYARWSGDATYEGATSALVQAYVRSKLAITRLRATVYRWSASMRTQRLTVTVKPQHTGSGYVFLFIQRWTGTKWLKTKSLFATLYPYSGGSYARYTYTPTLAGRYRSAFTYAGDANHAGGTSSYVTWTVR